MGLLQPISRAIINTFTTYEDLMEWRKQNIHRVVVDNDRLNKFHDVLTQRTIEIAVKKVESEWGPAPACFTFFMMGSAARFEQSVWSDQDHGLIYEQCSIYTKNYFLFLGEEISYGLTQVGYEPCEGKVMASNQKWSKSINEWKAQLLHWMEKESWESIRYLLTFIDSRVFFGKELFLKELLDFIFSYVESHQRLLGRMLENVGYVKQGVGVFGQLLVESYGENKGCINLKSTGLFPYVNALRLLAIKEKIAQPSTLKRFQYLPGDYKQIKKHERDFSKLLALRLKLQKEQESYQTVHYLRVSQLTKEEKKELKVILTSGYRLYQKTKKLIEKGCRS